MSFVVEPLVHDDFDTFIKVWYDAFSPEAVDQVLPMIYPGGLTPELNTRLRNRIVAATNGDLEEFCFVAKEAQSQRIVGVAWWTTLEKPAPPKDDAAASSELEGFLKTKNLDPQVSGTNQELGDAFYSALYHAERDTIKAKSVPYIGLQVLGVLPEFARQGVGSLLLERGLQRLDKVNVWTFLVASSTGKGLYLKHGFEVVKQLDFDARKYGGRSQGQHWVMWRSAQNLST